MSTITLAQIAASDLHSTKHARSIMRQYDNGMFRYWTNKNKTHRTVKCHCGASNVAAIERALNDAGYETTLTLANAWRYGNPNAPARDSIIARVYEN